jgi:uncharacterized protein YceK
VTGCEIAMKGWAKRGLVLVALILSVTGCQTARSWDSGCPGVYSGVRYFASQQSSLPWDGKLFFMLDLPLTVVGDTLLLPFAAVVEPDRPPGGWVPGCQWAE